MAKHTCQLRRFLECIVNDTVVQIPGELRLLAAGVLRRPASHPDVDDLVGEVLLRLIEATRRGQARSAARLLALKDAQISSAISHRMRQVVAECSPGARLRKQLRAAVRLALANGPRASPASPPSSLYKLDCLNSECVGDAVAWLLARRDDVGQDAREIAASLHAMYFAKAQLACEPVQASFESVLIQSLDMARVGRELRDELGGELARVIALRAAGAELKVIAADRQVAISTVHQRLKTAVRCVQRHMWKRDIIPTSLEPMLAALAE